jgi:hypothetical protein
LRYPKYFTWYGWCNLRKLDEKKVNGKTFYRDTQEILCKKYDVIITDYLPPDIRSKIKWARRWATAKRYLNKLRTEKKKRSKKKESNFNLFGSSPGKNISLRDNSKRDLSPLLSKKKSISLTGKRKSYSGLINNKQDYSALLGKNKRVKL